ncbi:lipid-A-disaccharide synthase [Desulfogranum mediterraneum]|uniref:lipid-A-disaccharide synthase n=1 Tax=Desulfogranum mediterraneum TaxID=160661 RepID=UPI00041E8229|nr:lipid-A-disaccharide synthase [Desulfogranum mediterraneum]
MRGGSKSSLPPSEQAGPRVMIVAGEASGDLHGANLARAIQRERPEIRLSGMGGDELRAAGVEVLFDAARIAVVGVVEVLHHLGDVLRARKILITEMKERRPALLILIDFPDFNLLLAAQARKLGIPVLYYISPQVWAWRSGRVKKIGRLADRVATILPFEQAFYRRHGYRVDYVGHPLLDTVTTTMSRDGFLEKYDLPGDHPLIGIIPGSRRKEISTLLPIFLSAAERYQAESSHPCTFLLPRASTVDQELLLEHGAAQAKNSLDLRIIDSDRYDLMAACDGAIAASGTVTLELAILETPTVVAYRLAPLTYRLGRLLIRHLRFFSLVNLIAEQEIIPELLQDEVTPGRLCRELQAVVDSEQRRKSMIADFQRLKELLGSSGASSKTAALVFEMLDAAGR